MSAALGLLATWIAWAALHSLLMTPAAKALARRLLGRGFALYRLGFNLLALATFAVAAWAAPRPPGMLYVLPPPWSWLGRLLQALGLGLMFWSFLVIDGQEFLGLRQARDFFLHGPPPDDSGERPTRLTVSGPYALCRHPMYLAGFLILLPEPSMGLEHLLFSFFAAAYFLIGSVFEEQRLVRAFGDAYVQYQRRTPRFFPLSFPRKVIERGPSKRSGP
ncbi:isoprenylcysteine carboxylmethyltransferase family protein [Desulfovibrio aminophilus]|nr:isoprenylcysteine carboxylmethyltransferase family protein [Desulfovibrio aminophilus]